VRFADGCVVGLIGVDETGVRGARRTVREDGGGGGGGKDTLGALATGRALRAGLGGVGAVAGAIFMVTGLLGAAATRFGIFGAAGFCWIFGLAITDAGLGGGGGIITLAAGFGLTRAGGLDLGFGWARTVGGLGGGGGATLGAALRTAFRVAVRRGALVRRWVLA
jgi:hypothetical protein